MDRRREGTPPPPPPITTRATGAQGDGGGKDKLTEGPRTVLPQCPHRGTTADNGSSGTPMRHTASTNGARPKHIALACREYGLLASMGMAVDPANTGYPWSKASHEATWEQAGQDGRET